MKYDLNRIVTIVQVGVSMYFHKETNDFGKVIIDKDLCIESTDYKINEMFGYKGQTLVGRNVLDLLADNPVKDRVAALLDTCEKTKTTARFTAECISFAQVNQVYVWSVTPFSNQKLELFIEAVDRSTNRKLKSHIVHQRLNLALSSSDAGVWDWPDTSSRKCWWSLKFCNLLGYSPRELPTTTTEIFSRVHKEDKPKLELLKTIPADCIAVNRTFPIRLRTKSGEYKWFEFKGRLVRRRDGKLRVVGIFADIHKKTMEQNLLKDVIDINPHLVFAKNREGVFTLANKTVAQLYGTTPEELIGKKDSDFNENLDQLQHFLKDDLEVINTGIDKIISEEVVTSAMGVHYWFHTVKRKLSHDQVLGVSTDITKLKMLTERLVKSNKELELFAYVASHDLQEPVRMIHSFAQLLSEECKDTLSDKGIMYLQFLIEGSDRIQKMILALLEYSRLGTREVDIQAVSLNEVINGAIANLDLFIRESKAKVNVSSDIPSVIGVPDDYLRIFQNLIENSLKFRSKEPPIIDISWKTDNGNVEVYVSDNGIGIAEHNRNKVFQLFKKFGPKDKTGFGIGLAICKRIMEKYFGSIGLKESTVGATFKLTFKEAIE